eukprot:8809675-Prorocentrum_lima.AAC.1
MQLASLPTLTRRGFTNSHQRCAMLAWPTRDTDDESRARNRDNMNRSIRRVQHSARSRRMPVCRWMEA